MAANDTHCYSCGMQLTVPERGWVHAYTYGGGFPEGHPARRGSGKKWLVALGALAVGGLCFAGAVAFLTARQKEMPQESRAVTAAELLQIDDPRKLEDPWVVYEAPQAIETQVGIESGRRNKTRTRFLLAQVQDRWLIVEVAPGFSGNRIEGQLTVMDSPMYLEALGRVRAQFPDKAPRMLAYQLNAEKERVVVARQEDRVLSGSLGLIGIVIVIYGLKVALSRPPGPTYTVR
jgi:hypothetical protein